MPHDRAMTEGNKFGGIGRRTVLKGAGISAIALVGASGSASAHHVAEFRDLEDIPATVIAGESFTFTMLWTSGHGGEACFVAAIGKGDGDWIEIGRETDTAGYLEDKETTMEATVPEDTEAGDYTLRVSATEWAGGVNDEDDCPVPGETEESGRFYVEHMDTTVEIEPPVKVEDVSFRGCGQMRVAFKEFPVDETDAEINMGGTWEPVTIGEDDLTTIPGQYGRDTPVYRHTVDGNGKLIGFRIVGNEYENDNRCAQNV